MNNTSIPSNALEKKEIIKTLNNASWFLNSEESIQNKLIDCIDDYLGFIKDLCNRPVQIANYKVLRLVDVHPLKQKIVPVFEVITETGEIMNYSYVSWSKGKYHSMRGILLVQVDNQVTHFAIRKSARFAVGSFHHESLGSIYPPKELQKDNAFVSSYVKEELQKILFVPQLSMSRYLDLGEIYPDAGMSDNVVRLFAATVNVKNIDELAKYTNNKKYNIKNYDYTVEFFPIADLLNFLSKTNDSFLLAIFGRLQALNVIKL